MEGIPRTAYYIATKVGRYQPEVDRMFDFSAERTLQSVDESLQRMGLDYVDVIQVRISFLVRNNFTKDNKIRDSKIQQT